MIAGHFGLAAAAKGADTRVPLWALMLATVWLDVLFVPLFVAGIEVVEPVKDAPSYGAAFIYADYTHSLVGALILAAVFGGVAALAWSRRVGLVLGAVVFSHWVLDLLVHHGDLPILPGNAGDLPRLGLGLWQSPVAAALIELVLIIAGALIYWRVSSALPRSRTRISPSLVAAAILAVGVATLALDFTTALG